MKECVFLGLTANTSDDMTTYDELDERECNSSTTTETLEGALEENITGNSYLQRGDLCMIRARSCGH